MRTRCINIYPHLCVNLKLSKLSKAAPINFTDCIQVFSAQAKEPIKLGVIIGDKLKTTQLKVTTNQ